MALYNVTPEKAAKYFHKTACFCFNKQTLEAGQTMEFPVSFWVDPAIREDPSTADVKTITLSYTFFHSLAGCREDRRAGQGGPACRPAVGTGQGIRCEIKLTVTSVVPALELGRDMAMMRRPSLGGSPDMLNRGRVEVGLI